MVGNTWHNPIIRLVMLSLAIACGCEPARAQQIALSIPTNVSASFETVEPVPTPIHVKLWATTGQEFVCRYLQAIPEGAGAKCLPFARLFNPPDCELNGFTTWLRQNGFPTNCVVFHDLREHERRGVLAASIGKQMGIHTASSGWPRLVPVGHTKAVHVRAARNISDHPFDLAAEHPNDAQYAVEKTVELGASASQCRKKVALTLHSKAKTLAPLSNLLKSKMSERIRMVAASVNIAFVIYLCVIMAWPDYTYPVRMLYGVSMVGDYEDVPVLRSSRLPDR